VVSMSFEKIATSARDLQRDIWKDRERLFPSVNVQPRDVLSPCVAAKFLGLNYIEDDLTISFPDTGGRFRIAGLISRQSQTIAVSTAFPRDVVRFTGAHEIAHWIHHPNQVMHRDRPLSGTHLRSEGRPLFEREADYFAACFLMPERLLVQEFQARFGNSPQLVIDETVAFHLNPNDPNSLLRCAEDSLDREFALAKCRRLDRRPLVSLAEFFCVSDTAMAIRIKELKLVRWP
jgi:IrrE N-terminal-like domain